VTDPGALARAYLKQQQALGTDAVVLPENGTPAPAPANPGKAGDPLPPPGLSFDPPAVDLFANDPLQHALTVAAVAELVAECRKCRLCESRTHTVPGRDRPMRGWW